MSEVKTINATVDVETQGDEQQKQKAIQEKVNEFQQLQQRMESMISRYICDQACLKGLAKEVDEMNVQVNKLAQEINKMASE